ncbi:MAG TPA: DUF364 domain-containing protein [Candidatus Sulfotelmatobacter sp.]|jgi:uncharacterized protein (DUF4213/DUF364 family)|nr:DUF364 domain-containing protein [Candidatus Sulfotelmatobacter sp.]
MTPQRHARPLPAAAAVQTAEAERIDVFEPVQAPWIRPGVVVHAPDESIDGLLAEFALTLRGRGFNVVGWVQRNNRGCTGQSQGCAPHIDYFDLANSQTLSVERQSAVKYIRKAMRENADLLVISRFSACMEATRNVRASIGSDPSQGMPLLSSIAGQCIHKWHGFVQGNGAMVSPDLKSLWRWWGPDQLYRDLTLGVAEDEVRQIACGPRWLMVEGPHGAGLAYLPRHQRELLPRLPRFAKLSLRGLAELSRSWDPLEMALGIAAINAHYNRFDLAAFSGNGTKTFRDISARVVVIGAFPGVDGILPNCSVIEAEPRPGEYPIVAMDSLLPGSGGAVINSSALINRSLPRILRLTQGGRAALIGPATPMTPRLHDYGLEVLGGLVVDDVGGLAAAIRAGALPREFTRFGRFVHLRQEAG